MTKISIFMALCLVFIDDVIEPTSVRFVRWFIKTAVNVDFVLAITFMSETENLWKAQYY